MSFKLPPYSKHFISSAHLAHPDPPYKRCDTRGEGALVLSREGSLNKLIGNTSLSRPGSSVSARRSEAGGEDRSKGRALRNYDSEVSSDSLTDQAFYTSSSAPAVTKDKVAKGNAEYHYENESHDADDEDEVTVIEEKFELHKSSIHLEPHAPLSGYYSMFD